MRAADIERNELDQLMSLEMQLSPVQKRGAFTHRMIREANCDILSQSGRTSQITPSISN
jgi:hypothetical protein